MTSHRSTLSDVMSLRGRPPPLGNKHVEEVRKRALPTIRVIHINSPQIVLTDVANFRTIVQQLTGNSTPQTCCKTSLEDDSLRNKVYGLENVIGTMKTYRHSALNHQKRICLIPQRSDPHSLASASQGGSLCSYSDSSQDGSSLIRRNSAQKFSEQDIIAGLVSGEPLPDVTMLPPLIHEVTPEQTHDSPGGYVTSVWRVYSPCKSY